MEKGGHNLPPTAKFSKEEIIEAALHIVRLEGLEALTARTLGAKLGSSARPIFTVFKSMDEVQKAVTKAAKALYSEYVEKGLAENMPFKEVGAQYIRFAADEPKLFQLLFMTEQENIPDIHGVLLLIEDNYEKILLSIEKDYEIDTNLAKQLYSHLWIYTHGIATLCATKMCRFSDEEINEMMTDIFTSLLIKMKVGKRND